MCVYRVVVEIEIPIRILIGRLFAAEIEFNLALLVVAFELPSRASSWGGDLGKLVNKVH